ncbi:MAG: S9 family peptidase [Micrococcales bacterium]|nr:MAG: S9 family peptidase [Micrococcales bacterium]
MSLVAENPGFLQWLIDPQLKLRGGLTMNPDGSTVLHLGAEGAYQPYLQIPAEDSASTGPVGFTRSGALLMLSSIGQNATRLERHDLSDGRVEVLAQDPQYDVSDVWQDPETLEVQAVEVQRARQDIQVLDDALAEHIANLRALTDGELSIGRRERSGQWWTVSVAPSNGAVQYWIYDSSCGQATFLFPHRQDLADLPTGSLAPVEPFSFIARDGLTIHGYVTFPVGVRRTGLPCVVMVHGGPWARDSWDFDPQVQWLANRGYVCVQVNFRGSTGYGKEFLNAGNKQWGKAMQDDVSDAVEYVVNQEWVDPDRVGIYGGSYGGYAVLAAAVFTPQLFRCGVDVVGPSNLHTLLASVPEYWKPMIALMHQRVGNPETEAELLTQASPLTHIVAALKDKGLPHSYLLFDDEGHGLAKPQNREVMFAAAEEFFAEHLGGRAQPDQLERDDGCGAG